MKEFKMKTVLILLLLLYKSRLTWTYSLAYKNYKNYNYHHNPPSPNPGDFIYTQHPNGAYPPPPPPGVQGPYGYFFYKNYSAPDDRPGGSIALTDILPADIKSYDKNRPPKTTDRNATIVYFHVTVLSIDSIDEESMTYVADVFLAQTWRDDRLRLPHKMDDNYRILDVQWLNSIWRPDCFFKNAKSVTFHEMSVPNHYLWLHNDKTLLYMSKLTLVLSCAMKFETFPHDTQVCSMQIESLSHTTEDLIFRWNITDPLVVNEDIELPQLDIARNWTDDCTLSYSTGNFTCLQVVFELRRRLGYHLFHTYIPSALIVVMSWISFWIKPEAIPARVTLGVTSLLTLATQNTQSQQSLPPVSYVKAIDIWMSSCTVFVFMSLMEFAVVNHFLGNGPIDKGYDDFNDLNGIHNVIQVSSSSSGRRCGGSASGRGSGCSGSAAAVVVTAVPSRSHHHPQQYSPVVVAGGGAGGGVSSLAPPTTATSSSDPASCCTLQPIKTSPCRYCQLQRRRSSPHTPNYTKFCSNRDVAVGIDRFSRFFFPFAFVVLNFVYWFTFL